MIIKKEKSQKTLCKILIDEVLAHPIVSEKLLICKEDFFDYEYCRKNPCSVIP